MNKNIEFALSELDLLMNKVSRVHGNNHPELKQINELYLELKKSLENEDIQNSKDTLLKIKKLANDFVLPSDACQAYTRVYEAYKIIDEQLTK